MGCEHCAGIYGIEESDGVVRCPLCGAETIAHYRDFEKAANTNNPTNKN